MRLEPGDILIDRIIDHPGDDSAWLAVESAAASEPALWRRLAEAFRVEGRIAAAASAVQAVAGRVPLPPAGLAIPVAWPRWIRKMAAAALLMAAAVGADRVLLRGPEDGVPELPAPDFDMAMERCLEAGERMGRVVRALPDLVLEQRPAPSGPGVEVVYVRRILERRVLAAVYELTHDERGMPVASPVALERLRPAAKL